LDKIEVIINAPASKVWKAISEKEQISEWLMPVEDFLLEPGNVSHMTFKGEGFTVKHTYTIKEIDKEKKLILLWQVENFAGDTFITYELEESGARTKLTFSLKGWEGAAFESNEQSREEDIKAWKEVIQNVLKNYIEKS